MKLKESIELHAAFPGVPLTKDKLPFTHNTNKVLMATHISQVTEEVDRLKKTEKIFMTKDYKPFEGGLMTILFHGVVGPSKQTIVVTNKDGEKKVTTEPLG
jgi:hypothetical protein